MFFTQEGRGRASRRFGLARFRTMRLPSSGESGHKVVHGEHDPRVTEVARVLRITGVDELPELVNVLGGDMSFVGPSPLPFQIDAACPYRNIAQVPGYELRSRVRPRLTGLARACALKDIDHRNKFRYDRVYVRRMSLCPDLSLILQSRWITVRVGREEGTEVGDGIETHDGPHPGVPRE